MAIAETYNFLPTIKKYNNIVILYINKNSEKTFDLTNVCEFAKK